MPTNTYPAGHTGTQGSTPGHTRTTAALHLAGHRLPAVRTHPGTVTPEDTTSTYGVRTLTVALTTAVLIYCTNRLVVDQIATTWEEACLYLTDLPRVATPQVLQTLHPHSDAGTAITTAITFRNVPGVKARLHRSLNRPSAVTVFMGPLSVTVYDRQALTDIRDAWSYAREAAERHWARERIRSDWDHVT